ncbi:MAG: hypothetical protein CMB77_02300 [Euryarchaeota archaeon]|nr:hypothetical protein [Euryarchaeota archaeon]
MLDNVKLNYVPYLKQWCVDERVMVQGKRQGPRSYFNTKEEAGRYLKLLENEKPNNSSGSFQWTMKTLVQEYIKEEKSRFDIGEVGDSVYTRVHFVCNSFLNYTVDSMLVADLKVHYITASMVQFEIMQQLVKGRAKRTVQEHLAYLRGMFSFAVQKGCRTSNPFNEIKPKLTRESNLSVKKIKKIDPHIITAALNELSEPWQLMTKFAALTGLRSGEQVILTWGDVDLDNLTVHVTKALKGKSKQYTKIGDPKTYNSRRRVYLDHAPELVTELKELFIKQGRPAPDKYVFPTRDGSYQKRRRKREKLQAACKKAGYDQITWHDLRHFYASILIARIPEDIKTISEQLGHGSTRITEEVYGHWIDDPLKENSTRAKLQRVGSVL